MFDSFCNPMSYGLIYYPTYARQLLSIRILVATIFFLPYFFIEKIPEKYIPYMLAPLYIIAGFGISYMTIIVEEGFRSIYFAGNMIVILIAAVTAKKIVLEFITPSILIIIFHILLLFKGPHASFREIAAPVLFLFFNACVGLILNVVVNNIRKEVRTLRKFLPICANCKKIRDDKGYWNQIEVYIQKHSEASFSHGMCPECSDGLYGDEDWYIEMKKNKGKK